MIKIGDILTCTNVNKGNNLTIGKKYTVVDIYPYGAICIENDIKKIEPYSRCFFEPKPVSKSELPPGTTAKVLSNKPHLAYFDPHLEYEMGLGMRKGAEKHGWNNHRNLTDEAAQQIVDSIKRHLNAYLREEQIDPELQINHLACVVNNINFLYRLDRKYGYEAVLDSIYGITK